MAEPPARAEGVRTRSARILTVVRCLACRAPAASDGLGWGWDLVGLADYQPNLAPFSPNTVWYVQAGALIAGHVAGLAVAHDRAVMIFRSRTDALRSQYAMLALMVAYTVGGLWLLSRG